MKTKTFPLGGMHIDKHKITSNKAIIDAGLPEYVYIPIKQHIGAPAKILVQKGDKVKVGTLLADADGLVSSDIHSSVSGEVVKIEEIINVDAYLTPMIVIKVEGDEYEENIDRTPDIIKDITLSQEEIVQRIRESGIVGMGGAGYPTPIKTTIPEGKRADTLIINGIECEAYLTADDRLMVEHAEEIIIGAKILNKALGIQNAIIAIDENKPEAIKRMQDLCRKYVGVNVVVCESKYPQGAEKQLIKTITGREVPSGKLPIDVHCIVQNVGTTFAVYEAVQKHKPLYERIITVSGDEAAETPQNFRVRVGTPASFLIKQVTKHPETIGKVIFGGAMMGISAVNIEAPTTKLTSGILLLTDKDANKPQSSECIRCARCADFCPMGLRPYAIATALKNHELSELEKLHTLDCIECGSCSYTCPARIPLLDYCKLGKMEVRKQLKK